MGVRSAVGQGMHNPATLQPLRRQTESSVSLEHHSIASKNLCPPPPPPPSQQRAAETTSVLLSLNQSAGSALPPSSGLAVEPCCSKDNSAGKANGDAYHIEVVDWVPAKGGWGNQTLRKRAHDRPQQRPRNREKYHRGGCYKQDMLYYSTLVTHTKL